MIHNTKPISSRTLRRERHAIVAHKLIKLTGAVALWLVFLLSVDAFLIITN